MELMIGIAIGLCVAPIIISTIALIKVIQVDTRLGGMEKSTHSIHPVPVDIANDPLTKFQENLKKMTGANAEDFNTDLAKHGFNPDFLSNNPDDLV